MNFLNRAIKMLTTPRTEWDVVAAETSTTGQITTGYVVPWTLLSQLAAFIGSALIGAAFMAAFGLRHSMGFFLFSAVLGWVLAVVVVYVDAWVVNALAPTFGSTQNPLNSFKLVAYASTGGWVGGLLALIPVLGIIGALAGLVYSIYLFYVGLPKMMGTPQDKVVPYMLVSALVLIVLYFVCSAIVAGIAGAMFGAMSLGGLRG